MDLKEKRMPKAVKEVLIKMDFINKYKQLYEKYPYTSETYKWKAKEIISILHDLGIETKQSNREQIFSDFSELSGFFFRFGVSIKYNLIHFDIGIRNEKLGIDAGESYGVMVQLMTDWQVPVKSPGFNSYEELENLLTDAVSLYNEIRINIIRELSDVVPTEDNKSIVDES